MQIQPIPPLRIVLAGLCLWGGTLFGQPGIEPLAGETSYAYLGKQLDQKIGELDWGDGASLGFCVMDLDNNLTILDRNADQLLAPGSPIKLYTALAGLELLGPEHRFSTTFTAEGWIVKRRLKGDFFKTRLVEGRISLIGGGDPTLSFNFAGSPDPVYSLLDAWIKPMREQGIRAFAGEIVVDATVFDDAIWPAGWPAERAAMPDYPEVSALNFNDNCVDIHWDTKKVRDGKIAPYLMTPSLPKMILFSNNVRVQRTANPSREYERAPDSNVLKGSGKIPPDTQAHDRVTIARAPEYCGETFARRLEANDIRFFGAVRRTKAEPLPTSASGTETGLVPFSHTDTLQSPTLEQIINAMLRDDRTLDAEVILRTLGLKKGSGPAFESGTAVVMNHLRELRIPHSGLSLVDGSGNSELNRASARHLMALMRAIKTSPHDERILGALARNGQPGDMAARCVLGVDPETQNPMEVHAIAGSITGGASLAGWTLSRAGRPIYFAMIVTGSSLSNAELDQRLDTVVTEIARSFIR